MMRPRRAVPQGQRGFSLLEVLVAFVIAGLALTTLFRVAAESRRASVTAAHYQEAVSRARSHLEGASAALVTGERNGSDGGFRWRVLVRAVDSTSRRDGEGRQIGGTGQPVVTLYAVTVWISWQDGANVRVFHLDSERLLASVTG